MCRLCTDRARYAMHDGTRDRLCAVCGGQYPVLTSGMLWFCSAEHYAEHRNRQVA
jgi:hypothetical protein